MMDAMPRCPEVPPLGPTGLVHEGHWFNENDFAFAKSTLAKHGFEFEALHLDIKGV